jgi:hypothetical protein
MKQGEIVSLPLPSGKREAVFEEMRIQKNGDISWIGHLKGDTGGIFPVIVLIGKNGSVEGGIKTPNGNFSIQTLYKNIFLKKDEPFGLNTGASDMIEKRNLSQEKYTKMVPKIEKVSSNLPQINISASPVENGNSKIVWSITNVVICTYQQTEGVLSSPSSEDLPLSGEYTQTGITDSVAYKIPCTGRGDVASKSIRMTALYTADLLMFTSNVGETRINYLLTVTNKALSGSGVNKLRIHLVKIIPIDYPSTTLNSDTLTEMGDSGYGKGPFANIEELRRQYGADLVAFIRPLSKNQVVCGIAYVNGIRGVDLSPANAFAVINDGAIEGGLTPVLGKAKIPLFAHPIG